LSAVCICSAAMASVSDDDCRQPSEEVATAGLKMVETDFNRSGAIKRTLDRPRKPVSGGLNGDRAQWLLAAVRRVRDQKQRPNIERIMNTLRIICPGQFQMREMVIMELEGAVSDGVLLRVGAAGDNSSCSYRDPGRVVRLKTHSLHVTRDLDMTKVVARSVRELADPAGSSPSDLHRYIRSGYNVQMHDDSDLMSLIEQFCRKAVELGKLECAETGEERRYRPTYVEPKSKMLNCSKTASSSLASHLLVDRAFKDDVSYVRCMLHAC